MSKKKTDEPIKIVNVKDVNLEEIDIKTLSLDTQEQFKEAFDKLQVSMFRYSEQLEEIDTKRENVNNRLEYLFEKYKEAGYYVDNDDNDENDDADPNLEDDDNISEVSDLDDEKVEVEVVDKSKKKTMAIKVTEIKKEEPVPVTNAKKIVPAKKQTEPIAVEQQIVIEKKPIIKKSTIKQEQKQETKIESDEVKINVIETKTPLVKKVLVKKQTPVITDPIVKQNIEVNDKTTKYEEKEIKKPIVQKKTPVKKPTVIAKLVDIDDDDDKPKNEEVKKTIIPVTETKKIVIKKK